MKITEIYKKYKITSALQEHQLRVAAVAKQICDNLAVPVDAKTVIEACLLHDMGNIIKFELGSNPKWLEPEGLEYWKVVQKEFTNKYGEDEHHATLQIAKELKVSHDVFSCIDNIGFSKAVRNLEQGTIEQKICGYSDMRVGPDRVLSLEGRLEDGNARWPHRPHFVIDFGERTRAWHAIESQIFENVKIQPSNITDECIAPIIEELRAYEI